MLDNNKLEDYWKDVSKSRSKVLSHFENLLASLSKELERPCSLESQDLARRLERWHVLLKEFEQLSASLQSVLKVTRARKNDLEQSGLNIPINEDIAERSAQAAKKSRYLAEILKTSMAKISSEIESLQIHPQRIKINNRNQASSIDLSV